MDLAIHGWVGLVEVERRSVGLAQHPPPTLHRLGGWGVGRFKDRGGAVLGAVADGRRAAGWTGAWQLAPWAAGLPGHGVGGEGPLRLALIVLATGFGAALHVIRSSHRFRGSEGSLAATGVFRGYLDLGCERPAKRLFP